MPLPFAPSSLVRFIGTLFFELFLRQEMRMPLAGRRQQRRKAD
jgi:hypothetical protein